jgi:hypothetical protein
MKLQRVNNSFFALLILLCCVCPWQTQADEAAPPATAAPAAAQTPCPAPGPCCRKAAADNKALVAGQNADGTEPDLQALKQRYQNDATGVRARLGMCRRGHGPHGGPHGGGGQQCRHRGTEPWDQP